MNIALIGPSFHNVTRSSQFFIDVLAQVGAVHVFWDESWTGQPHHWVASFDPFKFDCVVIWQWSVLLMSMPDTLAKHGNVIVVPMYDQTARTSQRLWSDLYKRLKILCFSSTLFRDASQYTSDVRLIRYCPDPCQFGSKPDLSERAGFFWRRTNEITESTIARLCDGFIFDRFTLHWSPDPWAGVTLSAKECPIPTRHLNQTSWYSSKAAYLDVVRQHNVFFAPRHLEGIGMAFLEAMAMGLCVIAPNTPTHNEYITHGSNGLLYTTETTRLDFDEVQAMGDAAHESMMRGHESWLSSIDDIRSFIMR